MAIQSINHTPPTTICSKTLDSSDMSSKTTDSVDDSIRQMKSNLVRYARTNDRRMVLRSLREVKILNLLSLDVAQNSEGPLFDLEKEVAETRLILNGVEVKGVRFQVPGVQDTITSGVKKSCIPLLKSLCRELCESDDVKMSSRELYEKMIVRLAKSTSSADPYFRLNSLLGSPDLLVMPIMDNQNGDDEMLKTPTSECNMYAANGDIHITLRQAYKFGLMRKADVKSNRPWFTIHAFVNERTNLSTNTSVRQLKVVLPDLY